MLHWLLSSKHCPDHSPTPHTTFLLMQVQAKHLYTNSTASTRTPSTATLSAPPQATPHSSWWAYTGSPSDSSPWVFMLNWCYANRWDEPQRNLYSRIPVPCLRSHRNTLNFAISFIAIRKIATQTFEWPVMAGPAYTLIWDPSPWQLA